jgi:hypothetical protein
MVKVSYIGIGDGRREFDELRETYTRLRRMQGQCKPLGPDYDALGEILHALSRAAMHFTKDPYFYGGRPH